MFDRRKFLLLGGRGGSLNPASIILDLDFANASYTWNGTTTLASALTVTGGVSNSLSLAQNLDGTFTGFAANTARVVPGRGLLVEMATVNRLTYSRDFSNAAWTKSNVTLASAGENPIVGSQPFTVEELAPGTTTYTVPAGVTSLDVYCLGPGGSGSNGVINTSTGAGGGGGACSITQTITVAGGDVCTVQIGAGGSGNATFFKDAANVTQCSAAAGTNAVGTTAGAGGTTAAGTGTVKVAGGAGGNSSSGTGNRGGGGGGGSGLPILLGGALNQAGRGGGGGNTAGGGGGGAVGNGGTVTAPGAGVGGIGGTNPSGTGAGQGGTSSTAATNGSGGGGGGGGQSSVGVAGANGSNFTWTVTSGALSDTFTGCGSGAGGGGFAGNAGTPGLGGGGGGGGSSAAAAGTGTTGGDGKMLVVYGAAYATTVTLTAASGSLSQTYTAAATARTPSFVIRRRTGTPTVQLSQDNGVTQTDVSSQLISGTWVQAYAPNDSILNPVYKITITGTVGDAVDIDLSQLEDNEFPTSPIPTSTAVKTRSADIVTLTLASYPTFITNDQMTILAAVWPGGTGISNAGVSTYRAWTWADVSGLGSVLGNITASISGTTMTVTDVGSVTLETNQKLTAGVAANTFISAQLTGTEGGNGTYSVNVSQTVASGTIEVSAMQGYRNNATRKPNGDQQVGTTVINGNPPPLNYGFDPQTAQYTYKAWQRVGFTTLGSAQVGVSALKGDARTSEAQGSWALPSFFTTFTIGSQQPIGANSIVGWIGELIVTSTMMTPPALANWTAQAYP